MMKHNYTYDDLIKFFKGTEVEKKLIRIREFGHDGGLVYYTGRNKSLADVLINDISWCRTIENSDYWVNLHTIMEDGNIKRWIFFNKIKCFFKL